MDGSSSEAVLPDQLVPTHPGSIGADPRRLTFVHATCVVVGETGILLRGVSGAGKTGLALEVVRAASQAGRFARLVGDDRVALTVCGGRVLARPHPALAGLAERRGLGLVPVRHESAAVIGLVVECMATEPARLPEPDDLVVDLGAGPVARLCVQGRVDEASTVLAALALFSPESAAAWR